MYPAQLTMPMAKELEDRGFTSLKTSEEVEAVLGSKEGSVLLVINSVCGCAAANARPAAVMSASSEKRPDKLVTVFAGVDGEAVKTAREFCLPFPPSSPSMGLFVNGKLVHFIERHQIEGRPAQMIAENLKAAYEAYC
jgi:putative YphP/YqiW family bacilliredoxin